MADTAMAVPLLIFFSLSNTARDSTQAKFQS